MRCRAALRPAATSRLLVWIAFLLTWGIGTPEQTTSQAVAKETAKRPEHVVLVIFGGGVRARELLDEKHMPTVAAMARNGRVVDKLRSDAAHAFDGAGQILTGRRDAVPGPAERPTAPTLMELVRVERSLPREKVWYVSYEGGDQLALAYSRSPDYGAAVGPSVATGMGAFGEPLAGFLERTGRPDPVPVNAWPLLRRMRAQSRASAELYLPADGVEVGTARSERVERALLEEIDRRALLVRGPNPKDERAWRAARTVLRVHRPVLTVIRLGEAERASVSIKDYERVLSANDQGLARIRETIADDPVMGGRTLLMVVPDMGRDAEPNVRGGLDAKDESKDHRVVVCVAEGPGFRKKKGRLRGPRSTRDVAPTLGRLLGVEIPQADGAVWEPLLVPE